MGRKLSAGRCRPSAPRQPGGQGGGWSELSSGGGKERGQPRVKAKEGSGPRIRTGSPDNPTQKLAWEGKKDLGPELSELWGRCNNDEQKPRERGETSWRVSGTLILDPHLIPKDAEEICNCVRTLSALVRGDFVTFLEPSLKKRCVSPK